MDYTQKMKKIINFISVMLLVISLLPPLTISAASYKLSVNKVATYSTQVKGSATKNKTVKVVIGTKTYSGKSDAKGNFSIKIPQQKINTIITVKLYNNGKVVKTQKKTVIAEWLHLKDYDFCTSVLSS